MIRSILKWGVIATSIPLGLAAILGWSPASVIKAVRGETREAVLGALPTSTKFRKVEEDLNQVRKAQDDAVERGAETQKALEAVGRRLSEHEKKQSVMLETIRELRKLAGRETPVVEIGNPPKKFTLEQVRVDLEAALRDHEQQKREKQALEEQRGHLMTLYRQARQMANELAEKVGELESKIELGRQRAEFCKFLEQNGSGIAFDRSRVQAIEKELKDIERKFYADLRRAGLESGPSRDQLSPKQLIEKEQLREEPVTERADRILKEAGTAT